MPIAPEPEQRSRKRVPSMRGAITLNSVSRSRSEVGRTCIDGGLFKFRPRDFPAIILTEALDFQTKTLQRSSASNAGLRLSELTKKPKHHPWEYRASSPRGITRDNKLLFRPIFCRYEIHTSDQLHIGGEMKLFFNCICLCFLLVSAAVTGALGAQECKPVVGHFEALVVPPGQGHCPNVPDAFCTAGRVWGGIQGNYQFVMTGAIPSAAIGGVPTILFFTGQSTIFLKSGDQLLGTDTGSIDLPPGQGGFASLITFSGGTGGMSGATGQIKLRGEFNPEEATTNGDYLGTLCTP